MNLSFKFERLGISFPKSPARIIPAPSPEAHYPFSRPILPKKSNTRRYEISDIFREKHEDLLQSGKLLPEQAKAVYSIINCRTETYGYHGSVCDNCGFIEIQYNSCRNRHCPKCQGIAARRWVNTRLSELLPVSYHHAVFTVPSYISMLSLYNKQSLYDLLFQAAAQTLLTFGKDPKHLGAEPGCYGILHTWSQTLTPHIHIHFIVTAGGLTQEGKWKESAHGKKFLFPVRALSKVFRGKFIEGLKHLYYNNELTIPDRMQELKTAKGFERQLNRLVSKSWRVYSKPPFSGPDEVIRYIGRYTHRIAISCRRILSAENGQVRFSYKDNKEKNPEKKYKQMTLSTDEFIRRFLWHVLPRGYHRIRNYGFLSNGRKKQNIDRIKTQLTEAEPPEMPEKPDESMPCPMCENGIMKTFIVVDSFRQITKFDLIRLMGKRRDGL